MSEWGQSSGCVGPTPTPPMHGLVPIRVYHHIPFCKLVVGSVGQWPYARLSPALRAWVLFSRGDMGSCCASVVADLSHPYPSSYPSRALGSPAVGTALALLVGSLGCAPLLGAYYVRMVTIAILHPSSCVCDSWPRERRSIHIGTLG